jgi:hypothetical protein
MRRPGRAYLVVVAEQAEAVFADRAEARDFADQHGEYAQLLMIPWWPAGAWRYGIVTEAGNIGKAPTIPTDVLEAQEIHARVSRRCTGAGLDTLTEHGMHRYYCPRCQARVH